MTDELDQEIALLAAKMRRVLLGQPEIAIPVTLKNDRDYKIKKRTIITSTKEETQ